MMNMVLYIAMMIKKADDKSTEEGQTKYRQVFISTKLYERYRPDVDAILQIDGYGECIVTE